MIDYDEETEPRSCDCGQDYRHEGRCEDDGDEEADEYFAALADAAPELDVAAELEAQ